MRLSWFGMLLFQEQTDHSDDGSYDFLGSEELNFVVEGIEELNCAGNIHEENELEYSDRESSGIMDPVRSVIYV